MLDGGLIAARRSAVLGLWWEMVLAGYPTDTRSFLVREKDRFQNPVGATLRSGLEDALDGLLAGAGEAELGQAVQGIVRVRAVQDISDRDALAFVFAVKQAARAALGEDAETERGRRELDELGTAVDRLALVAFACYVRCREEIFSIRTRELQRRTASLLRRTAGVDLSIPGADEAAGCSPDPASEGGSTA